MLLIGNFTESEMWLMTVMHDSFYITVCRYSRSLTTCRNQMHKISHSYRTFSAMLWPDNRVFQSNVQIKIISKHKENTKWLSDNLIYEGQLQGVDYVLAYEIESSKQLNKIE